jgi:release factor glutamine methyltransferase
MPLIKLKDAYKKGIKLLGGADYADNPEIDARVLLCQAFGVSLEYFYAHGKDVFLTEQQMEKYEDLLRLRLARIPVAYITGRREFFSLEFEVDRSVLIPRPATETLVESALAWVLKSGREKVTVIDLGTGSGNIALAVAYFFLDAEIFASDVSAEALETARKNCARFEAVHPDKKFESRVHFLEGSLFDPFPESLKGAVDLVLSNPPYVTAEEWERLMDGVRLYEPKTALVPPEGAEVFYHRIAAGACEFLNPGGALMVEVGATQGAMVKRLFTDAGFIDVEIHQDLEGFERVVTGILGMSAT